MSADRGNPNPPGKKQRGANPKRPTQAQSIRRQQEIVVLYEVENLSFAEIAQKLKMGEKEVREAYYRYVEEILPLLARPTPARALGYLRILEATRQQLARIGANADNDSARVGALRAVVEVVVKEIELSQHLGLLPSQLGSLRVMAESRRTAEEIMQVLRRHRIPADCKAEIEAALSGELERFPDEEVHDA